MVATPAQAQFSDSFKFLEAVKKKDGAKVNDMLNEPGSTIVNTRDITSGESALHIVTQRRDLTWMTFLIQRGANVNIRDARGVTPLVLASNLGFIEGVELLVERQARVDEANDTGETPLISAVHRRNIALVRILLKAGANPDRADNSGRSARDYAELIGRTSPIFTEIETVPRASRGQRAAQPTYGPTL
ncbi:MAG TPA: ankyrin repeat domain-containing protein [Novosphingobium sp.]|nr:ankyrin repeat domain-containing protein [Novosphingobium sp.]